MLCDVPAPFDLVVATPRRSSSVARGAPEGARPGRPLRIIATVEDSSSMRQMQRRAGYHLLVRRPTHPEIWRLLIQRALFQGDERRRDTRLLVGSDVQVDTTGEEQLALLLDISLRGCRVSSGMPLPEGGVIAVAIPTSPADGSSIELAGEVVRCCASPDKGEGFNSALSFVSLSQETRERLELLLDALATDQGSFATTPRRRRFPRTM